MKFIVPQLLLAGLSLLLPSAKAFDEDDIQDFDGHPGELPSA